MIFCEKKKRNLFYQLFDPKDDRNTFTKQHDIPNKTPIVQFAGKQDVGAV